MRPLPVLLGLLPAVLALACASEEGDATAVAPASAPALPENAVLLIDGHEVVTSDEVDQWNECVSFLEPTASFPQQRRLSLTNFTLPRAIARNIDRRAFEETRDRARAIHAKLLDGGVPGVDLPASDVLQGTWKDIGLDVWWLSRDMQPGEWSGVHESTGAFVIWRVVEAPPEPWRAAEEIRVERIHLPYLPEIGPRALVLEALQQSKLQVLDPAWAELVPLLYRNDMEAELLELPTLE